MKVEGTRLRDPFFDRLTSYAIQHAQPVFFGQSPRQSYTVALANGTGSLVRFGDRFVGVTCHHVVAAYRERRKQDSTTVFYFGRVDFDPDQYMISEDAQLDLATFDLTTLVGKVEEMTELNFVQPIRWPPAPIADDDVIAFAGFPGIWREQVSDTYLRFYSFSSGASPVCAIGPLHLQTRIEADECVAAIRNGLVLGSMGGLSGGPVFAWRRGSVLFAELIGFLVEYQEILDLLYIRRATCLEVDGSLLT